MRNMDCEVQLSTSGSNNAVADGSKSGTKMETNNNSESSSDESQLEIRLNEFVKKSEISDFDLRALVVRCSSCGRQINHYSYKEVKKHRKLGVITCKECYEFYGSSEFSQDESGYNYCTWCGNGGKLIVCDYCPNGFCSACIRRNFGRAEISVTTKEGWKCYCCNRSRLKPKVKFCDLIMSSKEKSFLVKKEKKTQKSNIAEEWLQTAFNSCEEACKTFHKKMTKLKSIGVTKSKSLRHIIKKMEYVIENHKAELKTVVAELSKDYESHIEMKQKEEKECKEIKQKEEKECKEIKQKEEKECKEIEDIDLTVESEEKYSNSDCIILDGSAKKESPVSEMSDASISLIQSEDKSKEEKIKAKLLLLKSSSESDSDEKPKLPMDTDPPCNGNLDRSPKNIDSTTISNDTLSKRTAPEGSDNKPSEKAKRKLSFSFSESSDSDLHTDKPNFDKIVEEVDKQIEISESLKVSDPDSDPKLKLEVKVNLIRCDHLLKENETCMKISDDSDIEAKLDKLVDSLCKFPRNRPFKKVPKGKRRSGPLTKASAKQVLLESSSSISLSSDEDEDQKKIQIKKKVPIQKTKSPLKKSDESESSSISLESSSEEDKKPKKSKSGKKAESTNSSDDFQVPTVKKKRKYDKLLHAPLFSDDGNDDKKPKEKKEKKVRKRKVLSSEEEKKHMKEKKSDKSNTSSSSSDERRKQPKKRRRIKKIGSSSDEDEDGAKEQSQDTPGKGRKNIRRIVSQKKLAVTTKEAQLEEKERRRRIQERQKLYNKIEDFSVDGTEIITRKMVLEVDQDSKEEIVEIHPDLVCKLKPHQVNGVKFMWECTIETVKDLDKPGSGCILAHCMGLGKTLQVIAFLHTCLTNDIVSKKISRGMIICPYNTALNWATEFDYWLQDVEGDVKVHQLTSVKTNYERLDILQYWYEEGGVVILSYDIFRRLSADKIPKLKSKDKQKLNKYLLDPGPHIIVCDEGHVLKNEKSAISVATSKLASRRRIVLTGTPLQNNLKEYHCMLSFVKPNLLGTSKEFRNRFVNPIINGQYDDSTQYDVKVMKKRIHILHKLLEGCVQRCDYSALTKFLPPKHEFVISVKLSEVQMKMYECYLEKLTTAKKDAKIAGSTLFLDFTNLRCIWTHPYICHLSHERAEHKRMLQDDEDDEEFINDESEESEASTNTDTSDEDKLLEKIESDKKKDYRTRSKANNESDNEEEEEEEQSEAKQWYHEFISDEDSYNIELSGKMVLLLEILKECESIGDKILLFSQSLLALTMIEDLLSYASSKPVAEDNEKQDLIGTYVKGIDYFRMDGATSADFRKSYIDMFNDPTNERARLFLISTRAGSLGTNLVGANRVIIFDTSWNPSHDVQAIFRVYRFGQIKPVYIYRLLAQGTMEEKIYDRQVTKLSLSCRVVDEQQIDRHFSAADLAELYMFDRNSTTNRPTPMVPKDRLLAELLIRNKEWIVTYHEHDSLLQNQTEEDLTEEERQAAWTEYENEREGRGPAINSAAFDINTLTKEPDFSQDYEGKVLPDLKVIVENLFEYLKREAPDICKNPLDFKKKILSSVYAFRQAFQEKHVKLLRLKQEFCTRGTVPNALNKYMDEVCQLLKSTGDYITRLSAAITSEQVKLQQQMFQKQQQQNISMGQRLPNMQVPGFQPQPTRVFIRSKYPPSFMQHIPRMNFAQRPPYNVVINNPQTFKTYMKNPAPVITEVDDNSPRPPPPSNSNSAPSTSTVTIEEIV